LGKAFTYSWALAERSEKNIKEKDPKVEGILDIK
jgi:hypothetical protein